MSKTVVVYHSGYGHTERLAQSVAEGAKATLVAIDAEGNVSEENWALLDAADAIIFGSPTYMGTVSWQFKKFADATSSKWFSRAWVNKVAGGFTISANLSGDKFSTLQYFMTLAMQQGMIFVGQSSLNDGKLNRLGSHAGVMAQVGATESAAEIPQSDLDTAKAFGERVSQIAQKLKA
jgi:multimeric flavodoxin WrbA